MFTAKIYWPNNMGHRECTQEYADMNTLKIAAYELVQSLSEGDKGYGAAYRDWLNTEHACDEMAANGHLGNVVRY